jgi:heme/copper-type cytochrome/quinol oxidase subunit 2
MSFNTIGVITLFVIVAIIIVVIIVIVFAMRRWRRSTSDVMCEDDAIEDDTASEYASTDLNK